MSSVTRFPKSPVDPLPPVKPLLAIGLMSGTSMDGIDLAIVKTDGQAVIEPGASGSVGYSRDIREKLQLVLGVRDDQGGKVTEVARAITRLHGDAVIRFMQAQGLRPADVDLIGFHGQTIYHEPDLGLTRQIGDGKLLAVMTGVPVVNDFRIDDLACGGEGAPLAPLYHRALAADLLADAGGPIAVLNLGGVANVTWIGGMGDDQVLAFDTGPASAMIDDLVRERTGEPMDQGGALALQGQPDAMTLIDCFEDPYFRRPAPKSLDRDHFHRLLDRVRSMTVEDAAATLVGFTLGAIAKAEKQFPSPVARWVVCGGGRHNQAIMAGLRAEFEVPVDPVEAVGWDGDMLEAQAFAFLAVRSVRGLPLSLPTTTNVSAPCPGGRYHRP